MLNPATPPDEDIYLLIAGVAGRSFGAPPQGTCLWPTPGQARSFDRAKHTGTLLCDAQEKDNIVFGPNPRTYLARSKSTWDINRCGHYIPRPMDAVQRAKTIDRPVNNWDDDRYSSAFPKNSLATVTQAISLSDDDQREERLRVQKTELIRHAESLLSTNKSVVLCEGEPEIVEEDRAEHFPEVKSIATDNHGLKLENDHLPHDAGNVQPEPVCNGPPQTRSRTRSALYRCRPPEFPSDFEDDGLLYDSYGVPMRIEEYAGDSSNQATATSKDKPISRMVIRTPRTATSRAPKAGTMALTKGKASGGRSASRTNGPPTAAAHAAAMLAVWPPISAPGATIFDQHDDAPSNATTRQDDAFGAHSGDM